VSGQQYAGEKVGFIGLGNMGKGMAKNLIEKVRKGQLTTPHRV
jgi:3-hydroxyisobutyrate dehydrogenase-like beta-hydroxyacid dehydrogenase